MAYPNLAEVKALISVSGASIDTELTAARAAAIDFIEQWCGQTFEPVQEIRYVYAGVPFVNGRRLLFFQYCSVITEVINGDGVEVESTEYFTNPMNGTLFHGLDMKPGVGKSWVTGENYRIAIDADWGVPTPDAITQAVAQLTKFFYEATEQGVGGPLQSASRQSGQTVVPAAVPAHIMAILNAHRRVVV